MGLLLPFSDLFCMDHANLVEDSCRHLRLPGRSLYWVCIKISFNQWDAVAGVSGINPAYVFAASDLSAASISDESGKKHMKLSIPLSILLVLVATNAFADGPYVVGEVTHSNMSLDKGTFNNDLTAEGATGLSSSDDGSGNQWRLQAGYKFNPYFAIEAGYIDLGKADYKASFAGGTAKGSEKAGGVDLAVLGMYPVTDNFSIFAKAGLVAAKVKTRLSATAPALTNISDSSTEVRPLVGAGFTYNVLEHVDFRMDYDHVSGLGRSGKGGKMHDDMISAGIAYNF